jgi:hypothetical protein
MVGIGHPPAAHWRRRRAQCTPCSKAGGARTHQRRAGGDARLRLQHRQRLLLQQAPRCGAGRGGGGGGGAAATQQREGQQRQGRHRGRGAPAHFWFFFRARTELTGTDVRILSGLRLSGCG